MTLSAKGGTVCLRGGGGGGRGSGGIEDAGWKEASLQHTVWTAGAWRLSVREQAKERGGGRGEIRKLYEEPEVLEGEKIRQREIRVSKSERGGGRDRERERERERETKTAAVTIEEDEAEKEDRDRSAGIFKIF